MTDQLNPSLAIEPNPLSFGQVPQKDVRVRVVRITNLLGEGIKVSIAAKSRSNAPAGQPPSGFFWGSLVAKIPFTGSRDFPVEFVPRSATSFSATIPVHIAPPGLVRGNRVVIKLSGRGLPREFQPK
jgi:hypothetical protein